MTYIPIYAHFHYLYWLIIKNLIRLIGKSISPSNLLNYKQHYTPKKKNVNCDKLDKYLKSLYFPQKIPIPPKHFAQNDFSALPQNQYRKNK